MNKLASNPRLLQVVTLMGRLGLSAIFIMSGLGKIFTFAGTQEYMAAHGMPMTGLFLAGAIALELGGGLSLLLGYKVRWGSVALLVFLIPATLIFHQFWAVPEDAQQIQMIMFMKNLSIGGALLLTWLHGAGPVSLDSRHAARRPRKEEPI